MEKVVEDKNCVSIQALGVKVGGSAIKVAAFYLSNTKAMIDFVISMSYISPFLAS
jgi:hypothetical protein